MNIRIPSFIIAVVLCCLLACLPASADDSCPCEGSPYCPCSSQYLEKYPLFCSCPFGYNFTNLTDPLCCSCPFNTTCRMWPPQRPDYFTADFSANIRSGPAPLTVLFEDSAQGAPSPIDQVIHWRPIIPKGADGNAPMELGTGPGTRQRSMQLMFLTTEPEQAWDRIQDYAARVDESGLATVRLAAPFIPTIPGTDTYTDQLW